MADQEFYTLITTTGKAKIANATAFGTKVNFTTLKVGDGNGNYYEPTESQTDLIHTVWSGAITSISTDPNNSNWIIIAVSIPATVGGFMIREVGIFDDTGTMIAIGKYPETYKPTSETGSTKDLTIRTILEVSNAGTIELKVDPNIIIATKQDFNALAGTGRTIETVKKNADDIKNLGSQMAENTLQSTDNMNRLKDMPNSILLYGGNYDGITPNDDAFIKAKVVNRKSDYRGLVYFPNNEIGNAVYYFTNTPFTDDVFITADKGVTLSFPDTNCKSFKNTVFKNDINIISRDRDNTGVQYKNDYSRLLYTTLSDNDIEIGMKKPSWMPFSDFTATAYHADNDTATSMSFSVYDSLRNIYKIGTTNATDKNQFNALLTAFTNGYIYNTLVTSLIPETSSDVRFGIIFAQDSANFLFYSIDINGNLYKGIRQDDTWTETSKNSLKVNGVLPFSYWLERPLIWGARVINANTVEIYLNGALIDTVVVAFIASKVGFAQNNINVIESGINNIVFGSWTKELIKKSNIGRNIKVAVFGDSITYGEGASISWADYLPKFLEGQRGINKVNIANNAVSGNKSADQLTVAQSFDFSNYDVTLILIGTNDIQGGVSISTFMSNIQSMIDLAKSNTKVILGIPPMFISKGQTGTGFDTAHFDVGAEYRAAILQLVAQNDIYLADTLSEIGLITVSNVENVLRDNLHPTSFGQVLISRCFARSIIFAITNDL